MVSAEFLPAAAAAIPSAAQRAQGRARVGADMIFPAAERATLVAVQPLYELGHSATGDAPLSAASFSADEVAGHLVESWCNIASKVLATRPSVAASAGAPGPSAVKNAGLVVPVSQWDVGLPLRVVVPLVLLPLGLSLIRMLSPSGPTGRSSDRLVR